MVRIFMRATSPCPVAHQRQKAWGRSLHFLPLQARHSGRGGNTPGAAPLRLPQPTRAIRANPCPIRLSSKALTTAARRRPLREKRCGGPKRAPPGEPPTCATPRL